MTENMKDFNQYVPSIPWFCFAVNVFDIAALYYLTQKVKEQKK